MSACSTCGCTAGSQRTPAIASASPVAVTPAATAGARPRQDGPDATSVAAHSGATTSSARATYASAKALWPARGTLERGDAEAFRRRVGPGHHHQPEQRGQQGPLGRERPACQREQRRKRRQQRAEGDRQPGDRLGEDGNGPAEPDGHEGEEQAELRERRKSAHERRRDASSTRGRARARLRPPRGPATTRAVRRAARRWRSSPPSRAARGRPWGGRGSPLHLGGEPRQHLRRASRAGRPPGSRRPTAAAVVSRPRARGARGPRRRARRPPHEGLARLVPVEHHRQDGRQPLEALEEVRGDRLEGRRRGASRHASTSSTLSRHPRLRPVLTS